MKYPLQLICLAVIPLLNYHTPTEPPELAIPPSAQLKQIKFEELGTVLQVYLPAEMDSFAHWDADCCTSSLDAYSYWHNDFPHVESNLGLCWTRFRPDSIFQFTVLFPLRPNTISARLESLLYSKSMFQKKHGDFYKFLNKSNLDWKPDTIAWINSHPFAVIGFKGFLAFTQADNKNAECLSLITIIKGRHISLLFECTGTDCSEFIEKMLPYARTIRFLPDQ